MITEWINSLEVVLEAAVNLLFQAMYLFVLFGCIVGLLGVVLGIVALLCLLLSIPYYLYQDRKEANAKRNPPSEPTAPAEADPVKGRAPGLSEHASPFGQTEARAERTLERPPP
ncbi:hypothetical protein OU800_14745 [Pseudomonas sp. GOM7]|uniref:hypothetical protein n=1 Tax=Pseudomonas sp. GOM7 TaxID=2998079 RepID=UPI00227ACBD6|nr:hypothetical protein [Pseudomonas sp. GOM7]WAJ35879.1 hypothetical protein OU800_14745 [Pseudomonas sp. GOM7]